MFILAYIGSGHFLGFKILNLTIFGVFPKNEYFWGMKVLWIFFWVITKLNYIYGSFLCILGSFFRARYRMGDIFWAAKISFFLFFFGGGA